MLSREAILQNRIKKIERDTEKTNKRISVQNEKLAFQAKLQEEKKQKLSGRASHDAMKKYSEYQKRIMILSNNIMH